ncbi:DUF927 domain-containing protein [Ureibacillus aquaedulcis]|uniref:DUF927 domain-containing protein n=1 Tax=Ureibacillus aquaedulcis TaxID=3058421 RepID=A0ABT8GL58_9BACL|nr:DUF927 domain-containing protein [Ureibacillus sp. BA0131]MDN4492152.1 DUF927 domain-containing protein [Ureibacillus sp. BA0131]
MKAKLRAKKVPNIRATTLPDPKETLTFGNFEVKNHNIYYWKKVNGKEELELVHVSSLIWINEIRQNSETNEIEYELIFRYNNLFYSTMVSRNILSEKGLQTLIPIGADIHKGNQDLVSMFLRVQEWQVKKVRHTHKLLGWANVSEELAYYHSEKHSSNPKDTSEYIGGFNIQPKGTFEEWFKMVKQDVIGRVPLEFALICGFAAPVLSLLSQFLSLKVMVVSFVGESSTGKTISAKLAVSPFGNPDNGGLVDSWNSTINAMMKTLANNNGVPIVFDEASINAGQNLTSSIYQFAEGQERKRLDSESEIRDLAKWMTLIIFTAEHLIIEKANQNSGLRVRILEYQVQKWTDDAEHAIRLKNTVEQHYGHAGPKFIDFLIRNFDKDQYIAQYEQSRKEVDNALIEKDEFSSRLTENYAVMVLTAKLVNQCFNIGVNEEALLQFIVEQDKEMMTTRTLESRAVDIIQQNVLTHQTKFSVDGGQVTGTLTYGTILQKEDYTEVAIVKSVMDEWLSEAKFSSKQVVLKTLKAKGYLDNEQGKNTRTRKIPVVNSTKYEIEESTSYEKVSNVLKRETVYVLKLPRNLLNVLKEEKNESPTVKKPFNSKPKSKLLGSIKDKLESPSIEEMFDDDI